MSTTGKDAGNGAVGNIMGRGFDGMRARSQRNAGAGRTPGPRLGRGAGAVVAMMAILVGSGAAADVNVPTEDPHARPASVADGSAVAREIQLASISRDDGRITVENEPLLNVIRELNRHSERKVKVDRSDRRFRSLLVTGQFRTGRPEVIIGYMRAAGLKVSVRRDEDGNILLQLLPDSTSG